MEETDTLAPLQVASMINTQIDIPHLTVQTVTTIQGIGLMIGSTTETSMIGRNTGIEGTRGEIREAFHLEMNISEVEVGDSEAASGAEDSLQISEEEEVIKIVMEAKIATISTKTCPLTIDLVEENGREGVQGTEVILEIEVPLVTTEMTVDPQTAGMIEDRQTAEMKEGLQIVEMTGDHHLTGGDALMMEDHLTGGIDLTMNEEEMKEGRGLVRTTHLGRHQ